MLILARFMLQKNYTFALTELKCCENKQSTYLSTDLMGAYSAPYTQFQY